MTRKGAIAVARALGAGRLEMAENPARIVGLPRLAWLFCSELPVEADQQVDQFAADRLDGQQIRQFGQVDEPPRVPAGPVIVCAVYDPKYTVVRLRCLVQ